MIISEEKQNEVRELLIRLARDHISAAKEYAVSFTEAGDHMNIRFSVIENEKEVVDIQNIMTNIGYRDLEDRKGWTAWAVEQVEILKQVLARPPKKSLIKRLFTRKRKPTKRLEDIKI